MKRKLHSTALHWCLPISAVPWRRARDERLYLVFFICLQNNKMIEQHFKAVLSMGIAFFLKYNFQLDSQEKCGSWDQQCLS